MAENPYNNIYQELVRDNGDAVGIFAYALYKQHKIAFINKVINDEQRDPTPDELSNFHRSTMTQHAIDGYRVQGESLVLAFLNESLAQRVKDIQSDVEDSVIGVQLKNIQSQLDSKKTLAGWIRDVSGNLAVNFLTILIIGAIILGYNAIGEFNKKAEMTAKLADKSDNLK